MRHYYKESYMWYLQEIDYQIQIESCCVIDVLLNNYPNCGVQSIAFDKLQWEPEKSVIGRRLLDLSYDKLSWEPSVAQDTHSYSRRLPAPRRFLPGN